MRFMVVTVLACIALATAQNVPFDPVARLTAGDISGAVAELRAEAADAHVKAVDANIDANDHARAAYDANGQLNDKAKEIQGQAVNNAQEQQWKAIDNAQTIEARYDGAAAALAPVLAKQVVRSGQIPAAYNPAAPSYPAPVPQYPPAVRPYSAPAASDYAPAASEYAADYAPAASEYEPNYVPYDQYASNLDYAQDIEY